MSTMTDSAAAPTTRRVDQLLAHYGESHRHPRNGAIHCVAMTNHIFAANPHG